MTVRDWLQILCKYPVGMEVVCTWESTYHSVGPDNVYTLPARGDKDTWPRLPPGTGTVLVINADMDCNRVSDWQHMGAEQLHEVSK